MDFTNKELEIISNGLLALIQNAGEAKKFVVHSVTQNSIDGYIKILQDLNSKICRIDESEEIKMITFYQILESLPTEPKACDDNPGIWSNGCDIMCETEAIANTIADFLESMGVSDVATTGYFDPDEDRRCNEVNECTGYYYVTCE